MNPLTSVINGLFTTLTGTDPTTLSNEITAAEQQIIIAIEVIIFLLTLLVVEGFFIMGNTKH